MDKIKILWADDEIDLLKPHILFLKEKGYDLKTATNGDDALDLVKEEHFDIVFLDENMPGISGLETLNRIKQLDSSLPVVMITKSEEESIMEDAIGSKIADYLIKPVNPNQILLTLKKNLDNKRLIREKTSSGYQQEFRQIGMTLSDKLSLEEWTELYKKLVFWELEINSTKEEGMAEILNMQKTEANNLFGRFVERNYLSWVSGKDAAPPVMSHTLLKKKLMPVLDKEESVFLVVIDNLRYDQWKVIQPVIHELFRTEQEEIYFSILPTATQYARNALFSGMLPSEMEKRFPKMWLNDEDEGGKNQFEAEFLADQLKRLGRDVKHSYTKITNYGAGKKLAESVSNLMQNKLNVIVYNFVDMLSHARTDMEVIRELADDEKAYRSITLSWFENSPLWDILQQVSAKKATLVITTDHGTIRVKNPSKLIGDRNVNTNLRYKQGKNMQWERNDVFEVKNPGDAFLPRVNVSTAFVFAKEDFFFAYPNNYNHYVNHYRNTFQHGGISLEEMLVPFVVLKSK
jgi:DNA-binding response OmpR family regulator